MNLQRVIDHFGHTDVVITAVYVRHDDREGGQWLHRTPYTGVNLGRAMPELPHALRADDVRTISVRASLDWQQLHVADFAVSELS